MTKELRGIIEKMVSENPDAISRDTWDIIDRFGNLDLYYTDEMMMSKYSKYGSAPNRDTSATL